MLGDAGRRFGTLRRCTAGLGRLLASAAIATLAAQIAHGASYPTRVIKIIVPFAPGGPTDVMARVVSGPLSAALGQSVVVENRPGAGGNIGIGVAAHSTPDGYTLLLSSSAYVVNPSLYRNVSYDPFKDFVPVADLGSSPNVIVTRPELGINTIADLVARAKAEPDLFNYASPGSGTTPHLAAELLKLRAGINMVHIPYNGAGPAIQAILAGAVQVASTALPPAHAHIQAGALKGLAVTGRERWYDLPDVPTLEEAGIPNAVSETFQALFAPAGTPPEIVERLAKELVTILQRPEIRERLQKAGFGVIGKGPESLRQKVADEVPMWREIVERTGIKAD